jgi:four helix bundle protein
MNPTTNRIPALQWDVFQATLELIRSLRVPLNQLSTKDAALVTQIRRAASSIGLNLAEGKRRTGRDRVHSWRIAAGSAEEVGGSLLIAEAWGHIDPKAVAPSPRSPRPNLRHGPSRDSFAPLIQAGSPHRSARAADTSGRSAGSASSRRSYAHRTYRGSAIRLLVEPVAG